MNKSPSSECVLGADWSGKSGRVHREPPGNLVLPDSCWACPVVLGFQSYSECLPTGLQSWAILLCPQDSPWGQHLLLPCPSHLHSIGVGLHPMILLLPSHHFQGIHGAIHWPHLSGIYFGSVLAKSENRWTPSLAPSLMGCVREESWLVGRQTA